MYRDTEQSRAVVAWKIRDYKGHEEPSQAVMDMFLILIVVMVSRVYTYIKTYRIVHLNICNVLHVIYTSIKLVENNKTDLQHEK